jgi:hypothetical protein
MKLEKARHLIVAGSFTGGPVWDRIDRELREAIEAVVWPPGSQSFTIYPERKGNGVKPIKEGFVTKLIEFGWRPEQRFPRGGGDEVAATEPGKFDAMLELDEHELAPFVVEWETGNISSSHRAMNKMALALKLARISGGVLVLPSHRLYPYLTDRIGNYRELEPYLSLYTDLRVESGYLGVIVVEQDATSEDVPKIQKGTDGWALVQRPGSSEEPLL